MVLLTEDKILIKVQGRRKAIGKRNLLLNFLTKPGLCLAWVTHTENQCHRLSGEEERQRDKAYGEDKRKHWISSGTGSQTRTSGTHRSVREIARQTDQDNHNHRVVVFFGQNIRNCDFSVPKIWQLITPSISKIFWQNFVVVVAELFSIISCEFCFNRLRCSYFITRESIYPK